MDGYIYDLLLGPEYTRLLDGVAFEPPRFSSTPQGLRQNASRLKLLRSSATPNRPHICSPWRLAHSASGVHDAS
jgi:hypothetical protein